MQEQLDSSLETLSKIHAGSNRYMVFYNMVVGEPSANKSSLLEDFYLMDPVQLMAGIRVMLEERIVDDSGLKSTTWDTLQRMTSDFFFNVNLTSVEDLIVMLDGRMQNIYGKDEGFSRVSLLSQHPWMLVLLLLEQI